MLDINQTNDQNVLFVLKIQDVTTNQIYFEKEIKSQNFIQGIHPLSQQLGGKRTLLTCNQQSAFSEQEIQFFNTINFQDNQYKLIIERVVEVKGERNAIKVFEQNITAQYILQDLVSPVNNQQNINQIYDYQSLFTQLVFTFD